MKASQEERNHLRKQLERMQEKQQADANLKVQMMIVVVVVAAAAAVVVVVVAPPVPIFDALLHRRVWRRSRKSWWRCGRNSREAEAT